MELTSQEKNMLKLIVIEEIRQMTEQAKNSKGIVKQSKEIYIKKLNEVMKKLEVKNV